MHFAKLKRKLNRTARVIGVWSYYILLYVEHLNKLILIFDTSTVLILLIISVLRLITIRSIQYTGEKTTFPINIFQKMFFKTGAIKNLANFTRKHLCWSLFLIKLQALEFSKVKQDSTKRSHMLKWVLLALLTLRILMMRFSQTN